MSQTAVIKVKKRENWLKEAYNAIPHGEAPAKIDELATACGVSKRTIFRWISTGIVKSYNDKVAISKILNINQTA